MIPSMTEQEITNTREKIRGWLVQEGLFKAEDQPEHLYFQIAAEFPAKTGRHLSVIQPRGHEDLIVVFSRIRLAEAHQKALAALPAKERERLIWQMRYDLLFQDCSFEIEPGGGNLQSIRFTREIYYDGLTKNELMQAIRNNFKCELYVVWKFQEIFGEGKNGRVSGPPEPMYS